MRTKTFEVSRKVAYRIIKKISDKSLPIGLKEEDVGFGIVKVMFEYENWDMLSIVIDAAINEEYELKYKQHSNNE